VVLQARQLLGDVVGDQITARRQNLAELDEQRPEFLEHGANTLGSGLVVAPMPVPGQDVQQEAHLPEHRNETAPVRRSHAG
jgi:hypothetical protein